MNNCRERNPIKLYMVFRHFIWLRDCKITAVNLLWLTGMLVLYTLKSFIKLLTVLYEHCLKKLKTNHLIRYFSQSVLGTFLSLSLTFNLLVDNYNMLFVCVCVCVCLVGYFDIVFFSSCFEVFPHRLKKLTAFIKNAFTPQWFNLTVANLWTLLRKDAVETSQKSKLCSRQQTKLNISV